MGKIETYTRNRIEGLVWALDLIEKSESLENGVDMLKHESRFRKTMFIPLEIPAESIRSCSTMLAKRLMNTLLIVFLKLFEDEFGWKTKRLQRLVDLFSKHAGDCFDVDPYGERYIVFSDYAKYFREEHGIEFSDEVLDELLSIEEQNEDKRLRKVQFDVIEKMLRNSHPEALEHLKKNLGI